MHIDGSPASKVCVIEIVQLAVSEHPLTHTKYKVN
jgi:hypothetical protein